MDYKIITIISIAAAIGLAYLAFKYPKNFSKLNIVLIIGFTAALLMISAFYGGMISSSIDTLGASIEQKTKARYLADRIANMKEYEKAITSAWLAYIITIIYLVVLDRLPKMFSLKDKGN